RSRSWKPRPSARRSASTSSAKRAASSGWSSCDSAPAAASAKESAVMHGLPSVPGIGANRRLGTVVHQIVTRLLPGGSPNVRSVAEQMRLSTRTLQRRLSKEGLTFAGVVARARFDVAQRLLADPGRKVIDVALELGYSDPAHFTRAFMRWTGVAPREFREGRATARSGASEPRAPSCVVGAVPQLAERDWITVATEPRPVARDGARAPP